MPPKAQTSTARRGRPAKGAAAPVIAPSPATKSGRVAKTVEPPKKRGRPAKTAVDVPIAQIDNAIKRGRRSVAAAEEAVADAPVVTKARAGRPPMAAETVIAAAAPKKRGGRPPKKDVTVETPATPKRRGRAALDLNRVSSSRVAKRTSPRSKPAAVPRTNTKVRPGLRQRADPVEKAKEAVQPVKKARGRPKKVESAVKTPAPKKKKTDGRGRKASAPMPAVPAKKVTARPKTVVPRKRRGYTSLEVADKFVAQVKQLIADLQAEDAANAAAAAGEADDEGEEVEIEVELGQEGGTAGSSGNLLEEEAAAESGLEGDVEMLADPTDPTDPTDGASDTAHSQELLARDEESVDELDDETELPSETAVLAEIAGVQDDVSMAKADQPELERQNSASSVSVDLHEGITEAVSIPQADGSREVDVSHTHVDKHVYEQTYALEPVAATSATSLFSGF